MSIEEIPSNELVEMTALFHRAFNAAGCNPACHCCYRFIEVGDKFKLSTVRDVHTQKHGTSNIGEGAFAKDRLKVIEGKIEKADRVTDVTHEVMLCIKCTPELFHERQHKEAKEHTEQYEKYRKNGGGCFRINGKIIH